VAAIVFAALALLTAANTAVHMQFEGKTALSGLGFRLRAYDDSTREMQYVKAAPLLNALAGEDPSVRVACTEIGIFGYAYRGRILDIYGLVSPEALAVLDAATLESVPADSRHFPIDVVMLERPEMVMTAARYWSQPTPSFLQCYRSLPCPDLDLLIYAGGTARTLSGDSNGWFAIDATGIFRIPPAFSDTIVRGPTFRDDERCGQWENLGSFTTSPTGRT
jgi:hypothetical protein